MSDTTVDGAGAADGRLAASRLRLASLDADVAGWLERRREADKRFGQYETQLNVLERVLDAAHTAVGETLPDPAGDLAEVYEGCRLADRRTVWVERVWRFFALRFDQRDGDRREAAAVRAADEVVWSCWRPCFRTGGMDPRPLLPGPAPLPYLDAVHAPEAFPPGLVPSDLAAVHADAPFVAAHLRALPIPTVRVPAAATTEPWYLGLVAHETAHQLQFATGLVAPFRDTVGQAVAAAGGDPAAVERWRDWSVELFADLVSVAMLGPWALWPIAELEWRSPARMAERRGAYPPGHVRLRLLAVAATALGVDPAPAWPAGLPAEVPDDLPDLPFVERVVKDGLAAGPAGLGIADWVDFRADDFQPGGAVDQWRGWFEGGPEPARTASLRAPRLVTAGIVAATATARRRPPERRAALLEAVLAKAYADIASVRAPERRAVAPAGPTGEPAAGPTAGLARALVAAAEADLVDDDHGWPDQYDGRGSDR